MCANDRLDNTDHIMNLNKEVEQLKKQNRSKSNRQDIPP